MASQGTVDLQEASTGRVPGAAATRFFADLFAVFNPSVSVTATQSPDLGSISVQVSLQPTQAVPEPPTLLLFAVGILGFFGLAHRDRRKAA